MTGAPAEIDGWASSDCYLASYGVALARLGFDPMVFGVDLGYRYDAGEVDVPWWPIDALRPYTTSLEEHIDAWLGLEAIAERHPSSGDAWRHIEAALRAGRSILVEVDGYFVAHLVHLAGRQHLPHRFALVAADGDRVLVVDAFRESPFSGWVPRSTLEQAMASPELTGGHWLHDARNLTIEVRPRPDAVVEPAAARADVDWIRSALLRSATRFLSGGPDCGVGALRRVSRELSVDGGGGGDGGPHHVRAMTHLGAIASLRALNADLVERTASVLDRPELHRAAAQLRESSESWSIVRNTLYFRYRTEGRAVFARIATRLEGVADLEEAAAATVVAGVG